MECLIEVPVKRFVKKYLENNYGAPARIDRSTNLGKYIYRLLEDGRKNRDFEYRHYPSLVTFHITEDIILKAGYCLTRTSIIEFNNFIEDKIRETMFMWIDNYIEFKGGQQNDAILLFQEKHGFDEETYSFEAIKKNYYRYRQRQLKLKAEVSVR